MSVYFIKRVSDGLIKVGFSDDPKRRLQQLQTGQPDRLEMILVIRGGMELERTLHIRWRHLNVGGEWFKPHRELLSYIDGALAVQCRIGLDLAPTEKPAEPAPELPLAERRALMAAGAQAVLAVLAKEPT